MISLAACRRLGPWLLGLFLLAQLAGVVPLISAHTAHVAGSQTTFSDAGDGAAAPHAGADRAHHEPGDSDSGPQHHALHDLAGMVTAALACAAIGVLQGMIDAPASQMLAAIDPILPERPPKSILSV